MMITLQIILVTFFISKYLSAGHADYSYDDNEASNWSEKFSGCGGNLQSPVNLQKSNSKIINSETQVEFSYETFSKITYNGHHISSSYNDTVKVEFNIDLSGKHLAVTLKNIDIIMEDGIYKYKLAQMHLHYGCESPLPEHIVNGRIDVDEAHFIFIRSDLKDIAESINKTIRLKVVGVLLHEKLHYSKLIKALHNSDFTFDTTANGKQIVSENIKKGHLDEFVRHFNLASYFSYSGSLTTPTCGEIVDWIVFDKPIRISSKLLKDLRNLKKFNPKLCDNSRPVQAPNDRQVIYHMKYIDTLK